MTEELKPGVLSIVVCVPFAVIVPRPGGLEGSRPSRADLQGANMSGLPVVSLCKPCHRWEQLLNKAFLSEKWKHPQIMRFECCTLIWSKTHGRWSTLIVPIKLHWFDTLGSEVWMSVRAINTKSRISTRSDRKVSNLFLLHFCMSFTFTFNMARCWICMNLYEHLQSTECTSTSTISSTCGHRRIQSFSRIWNSKELDFPAHCSWSHWVRNWKLFGIVGHLPQLHHAVRV